MNKAFRQSDLRGWTPIAFDAEPEPMVEWADLRDHEFVQPFFSRTLAAWRLCGGGPTVRTNLQALRDLDDQPCLEPDLIIAHPTRCGSTLLALLASAGRGSLLVSEPLLLPQILSGKSAPELDGCNVAFLRAAVRALGRVRFGTERRFVLKLNSQMTRFLPQIRRAFPQTPIVWLQRRPVDIIESNLRRSADSCLPIPFDERAAEKLRRVALAFMGATAFADDRTTVLDYRDLPGAAWTSVATLMGFDPADDLQRMREVAARHSQTGDAYAPRARRPVSEEVVAIIDQSLNPMYDALALRRSGT